MRRSAARSKHDGVNWMANGRFDGQADEQKSRLAIYRGGGSSGALSTKNGCSCKMKSVWE
jgi:hypothetical protein